MINSHWISVDVETSTTTDVCECGHPRYQHNEDGRCRAKRHRCYCRKFLAQKRKAKS